jgi:aminoglycoside phosphotransferase family enzyme
MDIDEPTLVQKVAFLSSAGVFGELAAEARETHMSYVFLAGDRVYKLKKPVRYAYLDFSSISAREHYCRVELELNRRLAPAVYLAVLPLKLAGDGCMRLGGEGETIDWLVAMRRLPDERMLDNAIRAGSVTPADIEAVAGILARFFRDAPRAEVSPAEFVARFSDEQAMNRKLLTGFADAIPAIDRVLDRFDRAFAAAETLLLARAQAGRIIDGHGDLRPEHVCLLDPPCIIDCLEFSALLRAVDPFEEIDYLGLECEILGAPWIGPLLHRRLAEAGVEAPPAPLSRLYRAFRALVRARLALAHLLEPEIRLPEKWLPLGSRYVDAAVVAMEA